MKVGLLTSLVIVLMLSIVGDSVIVHGDTPTLPDDIDSIKLDIPKTDAAYKSGGDWYLIYEFTDTDLVYNGKIYLKRWGPAEAASVDFSPDVQWLGPTTQGAVIIEDGYISGVAFDPNGAPAGSWSVRIIVADVTTGVAEFIAEKTVYVNGGYGGNDSLSGCSLKGFTLAKGHTYEILLGVNLEVDAGALGKVEAKFKKVSLNAILEPVQITYPENGTYYVLGRPIAHIPGMPFFPPGTDGAIMLITPPILTFKASAPLSDREIFRIGSRVFSFPHVDHIVFELKPTTILMFGLPSASPAINPSANEEYVWRVEKKEDIPYYFIGYIVASAYDKEGNLLGEDKFALILLL